MSVQSLSFSTQNLVFGPNLSEALATRPIINATGTSAQQSEEIAALQERFTEALRSTGEENNRYISEGSVTSFVFEQLRSGDNSNEAVAFLLNLFDETTNPRPSITDDIEVFLEGRGNSLSVNKPESLTDVLQLASDTFRLLSESNAGIGLRLSVLADQLKGLEDLQA